MVISATFGGLLADILSGEVPDLLKPGELYATASLIGGLMYILFAKAGMTHGAGLAAAGDLNPGAILE